MTANQIFIVNLIYLRGCFSFTQVELADALNTCAKPPAHKVTREKVRNWENYRSFPKLDEMIALEEVFQFSIAELGENVVTMKTAA